jgi:hypothetical protein
MPMGAINLTYQLVKAIIVTIAIIKLTNRGYPVELEESPNQDIPSIASTISLSEPRIRYVWDPLEPVYDELGNPKRSKTLTKKAQLNVSTWAINDSSIREIYAQKSP